MENEIITIDESAVKNLIYIIRGQQVMLDSDLAMIYGYTTKRLNEQVKRNEEKFPEDFMFRLTTEEFEILKSQNATSSWGGVRKLPNAFTEQGLYMLMTVLKGELATSQSIALIRTFKAMKDYIANNQVLIGQKELVALTTQVAKNTSAIAGIESKLEDTVTKSELSKVMKNFNDPSIKKEYLICNGETVKADIAYQSIYSQAKHSIYIVDDYISIKTLAHLKDIVSGIPITVFSDNKNNILRQQDVTDIHTDYPLLQLSFQKTNNKWHDRYIILDYATKSEKIYHCGASSKDSGKKVNTITLIDDPTIYHTKINELLSNSVLVLH